MKILTREEEAAHYNATLKGGSLGGAIGLAAVSHPLLKTSIGSKRFLYRRIQFPQ